MIQVALYTAGVVTGIVAMLLHQRSIDKAVNAERVRYNRRIQELEAECRAAECANAYKRGKQEGKLVQYPVAGRSSGCNHM